MERIDLNWLKDVYHEKHANIRHDLTLLEAELRGILFSLRAKKEDLEKGFQLCQSIICQYTRLLDLLKTSQSNLSLQPQGPLDFLCYQSCVNYIDAFKRMSFCKRTNSCLFYTYNQLIRLYRVLIDLLKQAIAKYSSPLIDRLEEGVDAEDIVTQLNGISFKKNSLFDLIMFFRIYTSWSESRWVSIFTCLHDESLQFFSKTLTSEDNLEICHSLFYFKIHPDTLYKQGIHPEKLISIKIRLKQIYQLVELIFSALKKALTLKALSVPNDNLLHGDHLPGGINLEANHVYREKIQDLVRSWVPVAAESSKNFETYLFDEIVCAYKFRFNPLRLIDVLMNLNQPMKTRFCDMKKEEHNDNRLCIFSNLSLSQCLDLYGHFSNKETAYLMKTMAQVLSGQPVHKIQYLNHDEHMALKNIHDCLFGVMAELRHELNRRDILTNPYDFNVSCTKKLYPGKRIRHAIARAVRIYQNESKGPSIQLENLFENLESS